MSKTLPLLRGVTTLEEALGEEENMLQAISYHDKRIDFYSHLYQNRGEIATIVSYHLGLSTRDTCQIGEFKDWLAGSFNVCIPVTVNRAKGPSNRVMIRFPLPYKVGEAQRPGNAEEKIRCEAATFVWIQEHCPTVPIPYLWGFGLADGQRFTIPETLSFYMRWMWYLRRRVLSVLGYPLPCRYVSRRCPPTLQTGYLLMEYIEETQGNMLTKSWEELRHDKDRRFNLFRSLSRIILSLARIPLPRIGSLTIDKHGFLVLVNRPLTLRLQHIENKGIPTDIDRNLTYSTTDAYLHDLLLYHDNRIRYQPNSILSESDGQYQLSALATMRGLIPYFTNRDLRHGPFILTLTDLHQSNIFVDDDWHVTCLVDLEWTCSRPVEMLHPPYWLTNRGVDQLYEGEHLEAYRSVHNEFVDAFEAEEKLLPPTNNDASYLTNIMKRGWTVGHFWFSYALDSPEALCSLFFGHIQPMFNKLDATGTDNFERTMTPYWSPKALEIIATKLKDKEAYEEKLRNAFESPVEFTGDENAESSSQSL